MSPLLQFFAEFLVSRFFFIVPMVVGGAAFWWLLRWMTNSVDLSWKDDVWERIASDPQAVAHYFGLRAVAVAIVVSGVTLAGAIASQI